MNKTLIICPIGLYLLCLLVISSCEEAAIPIEQDNTPVIVDTVSFPVIKTTSYQIPPVLGDAEHLYFGEKDGFKYLYNLIRFDSTDVSNIYSFDHYNDSLIVADSLKLSMRFAVDTLDQNAEFQLRYFPNGGDSVFNETSTNYLNFDRNTASSVIATAVMMVDSIDTVNTKVTLNFMMDTSIINVIKDTSIINFNRSFLVELKTEGSSEFKFHSSEKVTGDPPELIAYFRQFLSDSVVQDTSYHTYSSIQDVSIIEPPAITSQDSSSLAISLAKGLRSLIMVDMEGWKLPQKGIISSAELIYISSDSDTLTGYSVTSYPLKIEGDYSQFKSFETDPYMVDVNFNSSSSVIENILKINYRKISTEFGRGKMTNYGFKIQPSNNNDPFKTVLFHDLSSSDSYPLMRVIYVHP